MKRMLLLIALIIPVSYFGLSYFLCHNIDNFAFKPGYLEQDHDLMLPFDHEESFLQVAEDSVSYIYAKTENAKGIILYFHGNSGDLTRWAFRAEDYLKNGYDIIIPDYPGFGKSSGKATEQSLYDTADALFRWASENYEANQMVAVGRSMGTIPASYLSSKHEMKKLILITPFANMGHIIKAKYPFAPVCKSLYDKYAVDNFLLLSKNESHMFRATEDALTIAESNETLLGMVDTVTEIQDADHRNLASFESFQTRLSELLLN